MVFVDNVYGVARVLYDSYNDILDICHRSPWHCSVLPLKYCNLSCTYIITDKFTLLAAARCSPLRCLGLWSKVI